MPVEVKVDGAADLPEYASAGAAGAAGHVGLVWPRSGLAVRHGIDTLAATSRGEGGFGSTGR
jgi:dUTPase